MDTDEVSGTSQLADMALSRFLEGDETKHFSVKKGFFNAKGGGNSMSGGLVRISTGKAIQ